MFTLVPVVCAGQKEKLRWAFFSGPSQWWDHRLEKVIVGIAVTIPNSLDDGGEYGGFRFLGAVQNVGLINALSDHRRM